MHEWCHSGGQQRQQLADLLAELPFKVLWKLLSQELAGLQLGNNTKVSILSKQPGSPVAFSFIIISLTYVPYGCNLDDLSLFNAV